MTRPATTPIELASGHLRLLLEVADGRVGFVTEIDDDGRRMPAASVPNVLLGGLGLRAATVAVEGDGLRMAGGGAGPGSDVAEPDRPWTATITPCTEDGFTFEVTVDLTVPTAEPPAIELWLGPLSTIADRQSLTWRRSFVGGPVRNTQGLPG